eukprot:ANDGO_07410.mRNA.1 putative leucine-rich repeat receptor-like protein kinase At1g35710
MLLCLELLSSLISLLFIAAAAHVGGTSSNIEFNGKIGILPRDVAKQISQEAFGFSLRGLDFPRILLQTTVGNATWWSSLESQFESSTLALVEESVLGFVAGLILQFRHSSGWHLTASEKPNTASRLVFEQDSGRVRNKENVFQEFAVHSNLRPIEAVRRQTIKDRPFTNLYRHEQVHGQSPIYTSLKLRGANKSISQELIRSSSMSYAADCAALTDLYKTTNGPNWQPINWGRSLPFNFSWACCSPSLGGYDCDSTGRIVNISLSENQLNGTIPASLGDLLRLRLLDLSSNQLKGSIPATLGELSELQILFLYSNQLCGSIPLSLGNLSQLLRLDLYSNQLTGSIPSSLGNLFLLQVLGLYSNELSGLIPSSLGNLSQLQELALSSNCLTGSIPESLGNLSHLQYLYMYSNELTGSIPESLGNLSQLLHLYLYSNRLTGTIPASLGSLSQLRHFYLNSNQLIGSISETLSSLSQLQQLSLASNQLTGSIPESLGRLSHLQQLLLNGNRLMGTLKCESLGQSLTTLNLHGNVLAGVIPSCLCDQLGLSFVFLGSNNFTSFPNCTSVSMIQLDLSNNRISQFPFESMSGFPSLLSLDLSYNMLGPTFPVNVFVSATSLRSLSLAYNHFKDAFPVYACNYLSPAGSVIDVVANLQAVDLSGNTITGVPGVVNYRYCELCSSTSAYSLTSLILKDAKLPAHFPSTSVQTSRGICSGPPLPWFSFLPFLPGLSNLDVSSNDLSTSLGMVLSLPLLSSFDIRNNSNARKSQISYTNWKQFQYDPTTDYPYSTSMSCVQAKIGRLAFQADPAFFDYENCVCRPGFYGKPPNCTRCLSNAECSYSSEAAIPFGNLSLAFRDSGNIIAQKGYYASPSVTYLQMMNNVSYPKTIEICPLAGTDLTPCDATPGGPCKTGYEGRLCSACSSGYFRSGDRCAECPDSVGLTFFAMFTALAVIGLVVWSFLSGSSSSGLVKVLLFFWQALFFIRAPMPDGMSLVTHGASSMTTMTIAGPECFFTSWHYMSGYIFSVTAPVIAACLVVLIWSARAFLLRQSSLAMKSEWMDRCRRSAIFLFLFLFMSAVSAILASLSCTTDAGDGKSYLVFYPNEQCSSTLRAASSVLLVIYCLVVPGVLSFLVWRSGVLSRNAKADTRRMFVYSLLFGSYRPDRRWWELVVTIRRVFFVSAYVTIPPLSEYRATLVASVLVSATIAQAVAAPYHRSVENSLEIISLGILLVNLVCSVQSQVLGVQDVIGAGIFVFLLNIGFSAIVIAMLILHFRRRRRKREKLVSHESLNDGLLEEDELHA